MSRFFQDTDESETETESDSEPIQKPAQKLVNWRANEIIFKLFVKSALEHFS